MPTNQEESTLRQFCKLMVDIHDCRFIARAKVQDHNIRVYKDTSKNYVPYYDRDEFRSFATLFRKLVANREPTQLFRVMNILQRCAPQDDRDSFRKIKRELRHEAEHPPIAIAIGAPGSEVPFTPKRICDVLFNGMVFHSDPTLQDDLARLLDYQPMVFAVFLRYACCVVNAATQYKCIIEHHNYFRSPESSQA